MLARPLSMRACRVRSLKERSGTQRVSRLKQGTEFFELLAAVAGQFLQDAGSNEEAECDPERTKKQQNSSKHVHGFRKRRYQNDSSFVSRQSRASTIKRKKIADDAGTGDDTSQASLDNMMSMDFEAKAATPTPSSASGSSPRKTVKLSIKSFTVPELLIDMPESATVASLKKAVLDATMNLLGGGLRIRVFLHGKRVPDEEATLAQVGLSQTGKAGSLGFMLEPTNSSPASCSNSDDALRALSNAAGSWRAVNTDGSWVVEDEEKIEEGVVKARSEAKWTEGAAADSGAIVALGGDQQQQEQGLAMVSLSQKQLSIEGTKRRIRRPFTISEVEALVFAVEKLGLGRWRDVKLWAFDQAKHRTYVDLKDKWKTLVHTARIAPHQRRGEPVPQELLERVIRAQNFWTATQAKQQQDELDF